MRRCIHGGETLSCSFKFRQLKLSERGALPQQEAKGIAAVKSPTGSEEVALAA